MYGLNQGDIMRKRMMIPIIIALSLLFNFGFALIFQNDGQSSLWVFFDLGPAVMQDSYCIRSPGLESPFGMIGDIPGGYPLYSGNPLQSERPENFTEFSENIVWNYAQSPQNMSVLLLALVLSVVPVALILILGRRSYGSTKTQ